MTSLPQILLSVFQLFRDEKMVTQAIELNEQLHKILAQHDAFLSVRVGPATPSLVNGEEEEEDAEHLYQRYGF